MPDHTGKIIRYSLEEAANLVGVSKKSLDDYLSQLRKGRKYGFDFNKSKDEKVNRKFILNWIWSFIIYKDLEEDVDSEIDRRIQE